MLDVLILELRDSLGATVVVVSHELASIFTIGDISPEFPFSILFHYRADTKRYVKRQVRARF